MTSFDGKVVKDYIVGLFVVEVEVVLFTEVDMSTEAAGPVSFARFAFSNEE